MTGARDLRTAETLEDLRTRYARAMAELAPDDLQDVANLRRAFLERRTTFGAAPGPTPPDEAPPPDPTEIDEATAPPLEVLKPKGRLRSCLGWFFTVWAVLILVRWLFRLLGGS